MKTTLKTRKKIETDKMVVQLTFKDIDELIQVQGRGFQIEKIAKLPTKEGYFGLFSKKWRKINCKFCDDMKTITMNGGHDNEYEKPCTACSSSLDLDDTE